MPPLARQAVIVSKTASDKTTEIEQLALFNADGTQRIIPERAAAQTDVAALTQAAITGGEPPTEAEFNALRTDHAATRTVVNALLAKLRTANVIAP